MELEFKVLVYNAGGGPAQKVAHDLSTFGKEGWDIVPPPFVLGGKLMLILRRNAPAGSQPPPAEKKLAWVNESKSVKEEALNQAKKVEDNIDPAIVASTLEDAVAEVEEKTLEQEETVASEPKVVGHVDVGPKPGAPVVETAIVK